MTKRLAYEAKYFDSFDKLQEYIDTLGGDDVFITSVRGCSPISFIRHNISKKDYEELNEKMKMFYKLPNPHAFKQIMYRAKDTTYEINNSFFKQQGISPIYPYSLYRPDADFLFTENGSQCLEWGDKHSEFKLRRTIGYLNNIADPRDTTNYFKLLRYFEMNGVSFAGHGKRFYKLGYDCIYMNNEK